MKRRANWSVGWWSGTTWSCFQSPPACYGGFPTGRPHWSRPCSGNFSGCSGIAELPIAAQAVARRILSHSLRWKSVGRTPWKLMKSRENILAVENPRLRATSLIGEPCRSRLRAATILSCRIHSFGLMPMPSSKTRRRWRSDTPIRSQRPCIRYSFSRAIWLNETGRGSRANKTRILPSFWMISTSRRFTAMCEVFGGVLAGGARANIRKDQF